MSRIDEISREADRWFFRQWESCRSVATNEDHLISYARSELDAAGYSDTSNLYGDGLRAAVTDLIKKFSSQGHSGFSAPIVISLFSRLARFKPLTPLTGRDDEWVEVGDGVFQNRRCSSVFKNKDGAYNIDGIIWKDRDGTTFTNKDSRVPVTFPYTVPDSPEVRWADTKELV